MIRDIPPSNFDFQQAESASFSYVNEFHSNPRGMLFQDDQSNFIPTNSSQAESRPSRIQFQSDLQNNSDQHSSATDSSGIDDSPMLVFDGNRSIENLFNKGFQYTTLEIEKLITGGDAAMSGSKLPIQKSSFGFRTKFGARNNNDQVGNQNLELQLVRTALKTIYFDDILKLKKECFEVERSYKESALAAAQELQKSMNILYKLQMKSASLEESERIQKKLKRDIAYVYSI